MAEGVSLLTLVTDHELFSLCRESFQDGIGDTEVQVVPIDANANGWSAAEGLNAGLAEARHRWAVLAHQDVLFPTGWWPRAHSQLSALPRPVGVAGTFGVDALGRFRGHLLDPHGHRRTGPFPHPIVSLDEHLIIVDREHGLAFDESVPHFHCYGTDIVLQSLAQGLDAVVINAPVVHLSGGRLDDKFSVSSRVLAEKWRSRGVIPTCAALLGTNTLRGSLMMPIYKAIRKHSRQAASQARLVDCLADFGAPPAL
ncbi:MAG: hypothetical protein ACFCBV_00555 [Phycisphaerales bacterium]